MTAAETTVRGGCRRGDRENKTGFHLVPEGDCGPVVEKYIMAPDNGLDNGSAALQYTNEGITRAAKGLFTEDGVTLLGAGMLVKGPRPRNTPGHIHPASKGTFVFRIEGNFLVCSDQTFGMVAHRWEIGPHTSLEVVDVLSGGGGEGGSDRVQWCVAVHCLDGDVRVGIMGSSALQEWQAGIATATLATRGKTDSMLPLGATRPRMAVDVGTHVEFKPFVCPAKIACAACSGSGKSRLNVRHACGKCGGEGFHIQI